MKKPVKVFGAQRSGNNLLFLLLAANFRVEMLTNKTGGWTHGPYRVPEVYGTEVDCVVIAKHPLAWLPSMYRYEHPAVSFRKWLTTTDEPERWNRLHENWTGIKLEQHAVALLRYEDLLDDAEKAMAVVGALLGLEGRDRPFYMPAGTMDKHGSETKRPFDPAYYKEKRFMERYPRGVAQVMARRFDWNVAASFGYKEQP